MKKNSEKNNGIDRKYVNILGIRILSTNADEVLTGVKDKISRSKKFSILTPNPELVLMAQRVPSLKTALNSTDMAVPDGIGLKLAAPGLEIIKGRELFLSLIKEAGKNNWKIFLLGGLDREAELAANKLIINNSKLIIEAMPGPKLDQNGSPATEVDRKLEKDAVDRINKFGPKLLFVAFGNPKQEIWIHRNLSKLNVCGAMAVGGTFRYLAGLSPLPPKWMESAGLEWLFRLFTEPHRLVRILNAVVVFPLMVLIRKIFPH